MALAYGNFSSKNLFSFIFWSRPKTRRARFAVSHFITRESFEKHSFSVNLSPVCNFLMEKELQRQRDLVFWAPILYCGNVFSQVIGNEVGL